jgi:hypothetical protein
MSPTIRTEAWTRRTIAARKYQPNRIRLLLVAESPPADEKRYFYFDDARSPDDLLAAVGGVLFEEEPAPDASAALKELRRRGVFVVDLKPDAPRQGEKLEPYVAPLLLNLETLAPEKIVLVGAEVHAAARAAMEKAGLPVVDARIPWPASGQEIEFRQAFRKALVRGELEKLIRPLTKQVKTTSTKKKGGAPPDEG